MLKSPGGILGGSVRETIVEGLEMPCRQRAGGCALWTGSWSRAELGNMFLSQGALLGDTLPALLLGRQDQDPREDKQRLSQAQCWQGELSAMQRLPLLT